MTEASRWGLKLIIRRIVKRCITLVGMTEASRWGLKPTSIVVTNDSIRRRNDHYRPLGIETLLLASCRYLHHSRTG